MADISVKKPARKYLLSRLLCLLSARGRTPRIARLFDVCVEVDVPPTRMPKDEVRCYLDLRNVHFEGEDGKVLTLSGLRFLYGASFVGVQFWCEVDFSSCTFDDHAYFWRCSFHKLAGFASLQTVITERKLKNPRHPGEANFSYSVFHEEADFARCQFAGPVYLHRPVFKKKVQFEGSVFKEGLVLEGARGDVCCAVDDLPESSDPVLRSAGVVVFCRDHRERYRNFQISPSHPEWQNVTDRQESVAACIRDKLVDNHTPLQEGSVQAIASYWMQQFSPYTLPRDDDFDFRGVRLGKESPFRHVDLSRCLLERTEVNNIDFVTVTWPRRTYLDALDWALSQLQQHVEKEGSWLHRHAPGWKRDAGRYRTFLREKFGRQAVYDDLDLEKRREGLAAQWRREESAKATPQKQKSGQSSEASEPPPTRRRRLDLRRRLQEIRRRSEIDAHFGQTRRDVSNLYHRLMERHEEKGDRETARDFYYGEMETLRRSQRRLRASFSLAHIYKLSSGYSKLEGRALAWLLFLIFGLFPWLYWPSVRRLDPSFAQLSAFSKYKRTLLPSLEASTFLSAPATSPSDASTDGGSSSRQASRALPVLSPGQSLVLTRSAVTGQDPEGSNEFRVKIETPYAATNGHIWQSDSTRSASAPTDFERRRLELRQRFTGAAERLLVAFQGALFLIAIKSRFKGPAN